MPIEFKPLSMMEFRSKPGEILDEVARNGQSFVVERNGQQKACLVPISFFLPDIQNSRVATELDKLSDAGEDYRMTISDENELQLIFQNLSKESKIDITVTLPHGYPNKSPIVSAKPITEGCPHRWHDGTLCIYGAMDAWNPGKHDVVHALELCRRWVAHYLTWQQAGKWPTDGD